MIGHLDVKGMGSTMQPRFRFIRKSLRAKITLGVALPILLVLIALSLTHYWRSRQLLRDEIMLTVQQLGEVMLGSLRHTMLGDNSEALIQTLNDFGAMESIQQVQIVGMDGQVKASSSSDQVGTTWQVNERGCIECHRLPAEYRPRTVRFSTLAGVLRVSVPIANDADCAGCHAQEGSYLGVLLADLSVVDIDMRLRRNLQVDLALSIGITLLVTITVYALINRLVVRRVESFRGPLADFASGDFGSRLPRSQTPTDELGELANTFNRMADELERRVHERAERNRLRQRAIAKERGRIARELHDGLAQLLGYVNTKAMAVRLMLKNRQLEDAEQALLQLEEAARELFVDVREAISDLAGGQGSAGLALALRGCTSQFSRLSGVPVALAVDPAITDHPLTAETEVQLVRIVQEALSNVGKHASATSARVSLRVSDRFLELTLSDNGGGFRPEEVQASARSHFGLSTMRERAEEIGAEFTLDSEPGAGTQITVRLPLGDSR